MTEEETKQYVALMSRLNTSRNQRSMNRDEFDGMTYEQAYLTNQRASFSYLAPKINNDDVRINTGTTEKKVEYVLNQLISMNLQGEILAYDKDNNFMEETSDVLTDVVHRTEEMEEADDKNLFIYSELLSQPCVYVEELWVEKEVRGTNGKKKTIKRCERRLLQGPQIYLGDINLPDYRFNDQPFIFKYFRMTYDEGETVFGDWDRWKYVKKGSYNTLQPVPYQIYRKGSLLAEEIEGYIYMSAPDNEYQIIIQGVPMLEVGTKLPWDWEGYNITMVGLKPYHGDFAYSKPLTAAAKTLQALDNEMIRNLVRKFRQAIEPPTGVPNGKVYSRDIWSPGAMVQGVTKDMFSKLIDHTGVTQSEMAMFQLIEQKIDEFVGRPQVAPEGASSTATQIIQEQREAAKMLGLSVLAAVRLESKLAMMRVKNVLSHYTKPTGKMVDPISDKLQDVYARFTINDTDLGEGQQGTRVIQFADQSLNPDEEGLLFAQENKMAKEGRPTQFKVVNAKMLQEIDMHFHATAIAKPKDAKELEKSMYQDELSQAAMVSQMTGRPVNADKVTEKFERIWNSKDLFEKAAPAPAPMPGMPVPPGGAPQPTPTPQAQGIKPGSPPRPSVNTILNA